MAPNQLNGIVAGYCGGSGDGTGHGPTNHAAFKDLQVSFEEDAQAEVFLNIHDLWVVLKRATQYADIGNVYGVGLEGERTVRAVQLFGRLAVLETHTLRY